MLQPADPISHLNGTPCYCPMCGTRLTKELTKDERPRQNSFYNGEIQKCPTCKWRYQIKPDAPLAIKKQA